MNAEGAKVSQRTQKEYKKENENINLKADNRNFLIKLYFLVLFWFFSFLRLLRNLRALCVQKMY